MAQQPQAVYATDEVNSYGLVFQALDWSWLFKYGRPFIIVREQGKKTRTHGVEAIKVSIHAKFGVDL